MLAVGGSSYLENGTSLNEHAFYRLEGVEGPARVVSNTHYYWVRWRVGPQLPPSTQSTASNLDVAGGLVYYVLPAVAGTWIPNAECRVYREACRTGDAVFNEYFSTFKRLNDTIWNNTEWQVDGELCQDKDAAEEINGNRPPCKPFALLACQACSAACSLTLDTSVPKRACGGDKKAIYVVGNETERQPCTAKTFIQPCDWQASPQLVTTPVTKVC